MVNPSIKPHKVERRVWSAKCRTAVGVACHSRVAADDCVFRQCEESTTERQLPREKLDEEESAFLSGVIKTRTRCLFASRSSPREQDREENGLIDALGTRLRSDVLQTIESAAESGFSRSFDEIRPSPTGDHRGYPGKTGPHHRPKALDHHECGRTRIRDRSQYRGTDRQLA